MRDRCIVNVDEPNLCLDASLSESTVELAPFEGSREQQVLSVKVGNDQLEDGYIL